MGRKRLKMGHLSHKRLFEFRHSMRLLSLSRLMQELQQNEHHDGTSTCDVLHAHAPKQTSPTDRTRGQYASADSRGSIDGVGPGVIHALQPKLNGQAARRIVGL